MHFEVPFQRSAVGAVKAMEWLLTGVYSQVGLQICPVTELSAAVLAYILSLQLVLLSKELL